MLRLCPDAKSSKTNLVELKPGDFFGKSPKKCSSVAGGDGNCSVLGEGEEHSSNRGNSSLVVSCSGKCKKKE